MWSSMQHVKTAALCLLCLWRSFVKPRNHQITLQDCVCLSKDGATKMEHASDADLNQRLSAAFKQINRLVNTHFPCRVLAEL